MQPYIIFISYHASLLTIMHHAASPVRASHTILVNGCFTLYACPPTITLSHRRKWRRGQTVQLAEKILVVELLQEEALDHMAAYSQISCQG
mmetsp:Transcript_2923/g.5402  ORF Transcript_2923/g.5402 Transcript_2923/m.5402 type:complete len:91 (+) Transcript_2923:171-443(+)